MIDTLSEELQYRTALADDFVLAHFRVLRLQSFFNVGEDDLWWDEVVFDEFADEVEVFLVHFYLALKYNQTNYLRFYMLSLWDTTPSRGICSLFLLSLSLSDPNSPLCGNNQLQTLSATHDFVKYSSWLQNMLPYQLPFTKKNIILTDL